MTGYVIHVEPGAQTQNVQVEVGRGEQVVAAAGVETRPHDKTENSSRVCSIILVYVPLSLPR